MSSGYPQGTDTSVLAQEGPAKEVLPVFRLRDVPMAPIEGGSQALRWRQNTGSVQLFWPLEKALESLDEADFEVRVCPCELVVRCLKGPRKSEVLGGISGRLSLEVDPNQCWFALERDVRDPKRRQRHLLIELAKKIPGKAWTEKHIFKDHNDIFQRRPFAWTPAQEKEQGDGWRTLNPGRRSDVQDPFVISRSWLCNELQQGQSEAHLYFRIVLDQKKLDEALEKVPYFRLFGADICERYFKLFIRGDESSPIMLGELGGSVRPDQTEMELTSVTREVQGHRIRGTMETVPCLDVTLTKAQESQGTWEELIHTQQEVLNQPQGSLEDYQVQRSRRELSPDRSEWTPDDFADEQKEKADAAFKDAAYRDAIVYYTRALRHTPRNERLLSNRSAAYCKISKFQLALDDVKLAMEIEAKWPKLFYRKGQALRGLRRWEEAVEAFREGQHLDPQNPDWDKEVHRTLAAKETVQSRKDDVK